MNYVLDTDIVNYLLRKSPATVQRYEEAVYADATFYLSPVVHFEITRYLRLKGATARLRQYEALVEGWLPVDLQLGDWDTAADLWATRHQAGTPIADADLIIAVSALRASATLVTNNARHFAGLNVALDTWT